MRNQETQAQITRFNEFLNTKLSRVTSIELIIGDIHYDVTKKETVDHDVLHLLVPTKCRSVTFKRVRVKMEGASKSALKTLFRTTQPLELLRFQSLKVDDVALFMKTVISRESDIKTLSIDFHDKMEAEHADLGLVLLNLRFWRVSQLYINSIHIT